MKVRVTCPSHLRAGDRVGPFEVERVDDCPDGYLVFKDFDWQHAAVVAELLKFHEVWHDAPEPDVLGERIVARGRVTLYFTINGRDPFDFIKDHTEPGDEIIVVRGGPR